MKATWVVVAVAAAVLGGGIAVSASSAPAASPPSVGQVRVVESGADVVLPFDAYRHTAADINVIERATALLAKDCLVRFGHHWVPPTADVVDASRSTAGGRYGIVDAAEVAQRGYHAAEPPQRAVEPQPSLDVQMVYTGKGASHVDGKPVPEGGCLGEARRQLEKGVPVGIPGAEFAQLDRELYLAAQADERVQRIMAEWRGCMAESGQRYADVWAANDDVRWSGPAPTPEEVKIATADLACRKRTGLAGTWLAVETAFQQRAIDERGSEFEALATAMRVRLANARQVVG